MAVVANPGLKAWSNARTMHPFTMPRNGLSGYLKATSSMTSLGLEELFNESRIMMPGQKHRLNRLQTHLVQREPQMLGNGLEWLAHKAGFLLLQDQRTLLFEDGERGRLDRLVSHYAKPVARLVTSATFFFDCPDVSAL